ncbi:MAG: hypothetical protein CFH34_01519 [Alphaproteobacteria bacterium MarineAlpha9_Bin4]|nr:hypothetical protein [Pelagibacterales bacterium]PPR25251.1 MAG: hypothetical protein CFH34_01519 [Alphaproteobacteria bacterium MarineAlpha9_Bin4]|tara:strand:- start:2478 stop:3038 length:561 start_codon:yes stop_codon:yes gene_type:complete
MKYLVFFLVLINISGYCDNHDNHHHEDHDHHHEDETKKKSLKAHQHGIGILNIAQQNNTIIFEFELPGYDVVGFEYKARKKEDVKKVKQAINTLSEYNNMFVINDEAKCKEKSNNSDIIIEGNHTEFRSKYILTCSNISNITKIKINYFETFSNSKKLNVNIVSKKIAKTYKLFSDNNIIKVKNYF